MTAPKSKHGKAPQSLVAFISNIFQLNGTSFLLDLPLNKVVKACLYNYCKNAATLILLAKPATRTDDDYYVKTENAVFINATLIKKSQSTNNIDENSLSDCL